MTLNDLERLFHDKMRFRPALLDTTGSVRGVYKTLSYRRETVRQLVMS